MIWAASSAPTIQHATCASYSTTSSNSAQVNYQTCGIYACPGTTFSVGNCLASSGSTYGSTGTLGGSTCSGDQYVILFDASGNQLSVSHDSCGLCASLTYFVPMSSPCQTFSLHQGCYQQGACTGQMTVYGAAIAPTPAYVQPTVSPTAAPTAPPTSIPTTMPTFKPTAAPSSVPSVAPSPVPSAKPTFIPSYVPTVLPTPAPSSAPSVTPTPIPTAIPTSPLLPMNFYPTATTLIRNNLLGMISLPTDYFITFSINIIAVVTGNYANIIHLTATNTNYGTQSNNERK